VGRMRNALGDLFYGSKDASHSPQANTAGHLGPPPPAPEDAPAPGVWQYTLPGYRTPVIQRVRRQTSSIQGNIIRLLKATDMDTSNMFPYVRAALIGHASRNHNTRNTRRRGSCAQLYRECPAHPDDLVDYLNNHKGGLVNQVEPSVNEEVGPLVSAILAEAIGGDEYISGGSTASSSSSNADGGLASLLIHAGSNFAINQMLGSGGDSDSDSNSGSSDGNGGILSSITNLFG